MVSNVVIIGGSGALGQAFTHLLAGQHQQATVHSFSRQSVTPSASNIICHTIDYQSEDSIKQAAFMASNSGPLDLVIVATGLLHQGALLPEKSLGQLSADKFRHVFEVNTILPALVMKHFLLHMNRDSRSVFAALSARIGSISDNRAGGWYAYRSSKAALNMILKNAAIEIARRNKQLIVVGLHPGTVDSPLSKPFQNNVPPEKLFTADVSATHLLNVLASLTPDQSGTCLAWDGTEIEP